MHLWQKWREDYDTYLKDAADETETVDDALLREVTCKLAEAQANNAPVNEKRRQYFFLCVLMAALATIPTAVQAFLYLLLKLQGV